MAIFRKKSADDVPRRRQVSNETRESAATHTDQQTFRRNRTLTGSSSDAISSSEHPQSDMLSHRSHAHRLAHVRRRIGSLLVFIIGGIILSFWLLTQLTAQVTIAFTDTTINDVQNTSKYQQAVNDYLAINPFARLRFLLDTEDLTKYLHTKVAEVDSVDSAHMGSIGETIFSFSMRKPVAGWKLGDKQYYVDAKGVAFEKNYFESPSVQIVDESGAALQQGTLIASNQFLGFVGRVVALSKARGYTVTDAILPAGTTRQLDIKLSGVVPVIKLSIDRPAGEQVEDMSRSLTYLTSRGAVPAYIDVRVSGKAYYK